MAPPHKTDHFHLSCRRLWNHYADYDDALHFQNALRKVYDIATDKTGVLYCGLTLEWNHDKGFVDISMPGYVAKALRRFNHPKPVKQQHSPHQWDVPAYGAKVQYAKPESTLPILPPKERTKIQQIVGT